MKKRHIILILMLILPISICFIIFFAKNLIIIPIVLMIIMTKIVPPLMIIFMIYAVVKKIKLHKKYDKLIEKYGQKVYTETKLYPIENYSDEELDDINEEYSKKGYHVGYTYERNGNKYKIKGLTIFLSHTFKDGTILHYSFIEEEFKNMLIDDYNNVYCIKGDFDKEGKHIMYAVPENIYEEIDKIVSNRFY